MSVIYYWESLAVVVLVSATDFSAHYNNYNDTYLAQYLTVLQSVIPVYLQCLR